MKQHNPTILSSHTFTETKLTN